MTKVGKTTSDNTDTDYDICHFKMCPEDGDIDHNTFVGLVEAIEKIRDAIRTQLLLESHHPIGNSITINSHHYNVDSIGITILAYVGNAKDYRSTRFYDR